MRTWGRLPTLASPAPAGDRAAPLDKPLDHWSQARRIAPVIASSNRSNLLIYRRLIVVPGEGFEPPTFGLQNRCTATVLTRLALRPHLFANDQLRAMTVLQHP